MAGSSVSISAAAPVADGAPQWRVTLWGMVAAQLAMSMCFSFLSPVMPLFLPELGVHSASGVDLWSGILASVTSFIGAFAQPVWGRMSDRYGRKLMVLRSGLAIAVCIFLMGMVGTVWQMLGLRVVMGFFSGFNAAAVVLVASQVPDRRLGYALGLLSTGSLSGALLGPLLGGAVMDVTGSFRLPFYVAGCLGLVAFLLCLLIVPERFKRPSEHRKGASFFESLRMITRSRVLLALVLTLLMVQFATQSIQPVITLFVQELIGNPPSLGTLAGLAFSSTGFTAVLAAPLLGRLTDRIGGRTVLLVSIAGAALLTAPQAVVQGYWGFLGERLVLGLFVEGIIPAANVLIGRMTPVEDRGFVYGTTSSANFLGNALGPMTGGAVGALFGLRWVFVVTAVLLFAALAWVYVVVPKRPEPAA